MSEIFDYHGFADNKITTSKINCYLQCQAKFRFQYIEKIKAPSRSALLRGIAFHSAVAGNYGQKIETQQDLPIDDVLDIFGAQFDLGVPDTMFFNDEKPGEIKDSGYGMLKVYQKDIAPAVLPKVVEMPFELALVGTDMVFSGRVDTITMDEIIIDQKTKKARPAYVDEGHKIQMTAYTAGFQVENKRKPQKSRLDYVVDKKTPECVSFDVDITDNDIDLLLNMIGRYQKAMELGLDMPNRTSFMCSRRYCGYFAECEARFGGTVRE